MTALLCFALLSSARLFLFPHLGRASLSAACILGILACDTVLVGYARIPPILYPTIHIRLHRDSRAPASLCLCVFLLQCSKDCAPPPKPIPTTCGLLPPHIASCAQPLVDSLPALSSILIIIIENSSSYYSCLPHRTHGPVASSSSSFQNTLHCSFTYGGTSSTFCASSGACTTTIAMPAARCQSM